MAPQTWTRKRNDWMGVLSVLLLAAIVGCEGGGGGETPNTLPTFLEGTQSALHVQAQGAVTFRVRAQDAESASLRFSWEASPGTLTTDRATPVQVPGLAGVTLLAAGSSHSLALHNDGTLWAWGGNGNGQLGDGTTVRRTTPAQVPDLAGITAISAGYDLSLVLSRNGTVWAWGFNGAGQLGDGTRTTRTTPVQVSGLKGITAVAAGTNHAMALRNDGTVWAWGNNDHGQLGDGSTTSSTTPVQVSGLTGITAISVGYDHSLALGNDGTVWAWGNNDHGQLGDGSTPSHTTPARIAGLNALLKLAQAVQAALEQRRGSPVVPTLADSPTLRPARSTSRRGKGRAVKR